MRNSSLPCWGSANNEEFVSAIVMSVDSDAIAAADESAAE